MKMTVADYIARALYRAGVKESFIITGGFSMPLTDALVHRDEIKWYCMHHEQAATMAAEANARFTGKLGAVYVTAGPAATNCLTGVVGAWVDNSPCIVVAGQGKLAQAKVTGVRQFPLQGFETLPIYKLVTKYAVMLDDPNRVVYEVEKAICLAMHGRVGPVWVEVPLDIQGATIDPDTQKGFDSSEIFHSVVEESGLQAKVKEAFELLKSAKRPVILAGAGVRLSGAIRELHTFVEKFNLPLTTSRLGMDLIGFDHPRFVGHPGTYGDRPANIAIQNSDVFISIGCRLGVGLVGHDYDDFARYSRKIVVDIDPTELNKPSVKADVKVHCDAKRFLELLAIEADTAGWKFKGADWVEQTQVWKKKYPVDLPEYENEKEGMNSYNFTRLFSEKLGNDAVCVLDTGSCFHVWAQAFKVKFGQRHIITGGLSTMGYMPASIGVAAAIPGRDVICVSGDGSMQMNIQELQTIVHHKLPIKLIVFDNKGYLLIRLSQKNFHGDRRWGEGPETGVSFPDPEKLCAAYGMKFIRINGAADFESGVREVLAHKGPVWCNVHCPKEQLLIPRVASEKLPDGRMRSKPYDDMFPFLPREEYEENCVRNRG